jgi:hypothetical protein
MVPPDPSAGVVYPFRCGNLTGKLHNVVHLGKAGSVWRPISSLSDSQKARITGVVTVPSLLDRQFALRAVRAHSADPDIA